MALLALAPNTGKVASIAILSASGQAFHKFSLQHSAPQISKCSFPAAVFASNFCNNLGWPHLKTERMRQFDSRSLGSLIEPWIELMLFI